MNKSENQEVCKLIKDESSDKTSKAQTYVRGAEPVKTMTLVEVAKKVVDAFCNTIDNSSKPGRAR